MIDGISFIEKLSFNAFNEGTRLKHCVSLSKKLTGVDVKKIGGDQGYSGNDNRTFCKENGIETSFTQKGRTGKLRTLLNENLHAFELQQWKALLELRRSIMVCERLLQG